MAPLALCRQLFKDYQFGLQLIQKNTDQSVFKLTPAAIEDPDRYLSDFLVASYRDRRPSAAE